MAYQINTLHAVLFALAMGLLAHVFVGYLPFPVGDDFAYGPLAEARANPALYPRDTQLHLFANHARIYDWIYTAAQKGPGVEPVFRAIVWTLAIAVCGALLVVLKALRTPMAALPIVLGLGVLGQVDGLGRGDFGGLISVFFHHHNVALALVLAAAAAGLSKRTVAAGVLLGLAAYAQPMTALHGALIVGLGTLLARPRETLMLAGVSMVIAIPAAWLIVTQLPSGAAAPIGLDLIRDAYRFRAPAHYDPPWTSIGLTTLYLLAGFVGALLLAPTQRDSARFGIGMVVAFMLLHFVTIVVYKRELFEITPLFILDANRSSPLIFVLGPALALAGMWHRGISAASAVAGLLLIAVLAVNFTPPGLAFIALGGLMLALARFQWGPRLALGASVVAVGLLFPPQPLPPETTAEQRAMFERIRVETPTDALFVIPIHFAAFRHYTQRSAYVDFKLFSVAQPDQAALTRQRIDTVLDPAPELGALTGWPAAFLWDQAQHRRADCATMGAILAAAEAEYYLRMVGEGEVTPLCPELPILFQSPTLALYGPAGP